MSAINVAILGATGAVGTRMIEQLEQSEIKINHLKLLASPRSVGKTKSFRGTTYTVEAATPESFVDIDLVLSSAGGAVSKKLLPFAVKAGAICIDNTSAFRMDPKVPLVIPEVNPNDLDWHQGIIANPNCSTIQMLVALAPLDQKYGLRQIIVSTYQAASGAGQSAWNELLDQAQQHLNGNPETASILPVSGAPKHYPLAFNLLPQIDVFEDDGYTHEEWKMIHESKKILRHDMDNPDLKVTATCVRVPVPVGHGESIYFKLNQNPTVTDLKKTLEAAAGVTLQDDPANQLYPQPITAEGQRDTFVGRIRPDYENPGSYNFWVVSDNLLKGAAWNAVQIAETLLQRNLLG